MGKIKFKTKCAGCIHCEMCGWIKYVKDDGCEWFDNGNKWIPVSEKLPEEDGQYLITVKYKPEADYEDIYAEHGEWTDGRWDMFCFGHCGEVEDIIAWMPLPKPYKPQKVRCRNA